MKIFLPQFIYSNTSYSKPLTQKSRRPVQVSLKEQHKTQVNHRILSPTIHSKNRKQYLQHSKSLMKTSQEFFKEVNNQEKQQRGSKQFNAMSKNKSDVLNKLSNICSKQKVYCMDFEQVPIELEPQLQQLQSYKKKRENLIHSRKNNKSITKNLIQFRKNSENRYQKRSRSSNKTENHLGNCSFLITKKVRDSQLKQAQSKRIKTGKQSNNSHKLIYQGRSRSQKQHPECSPWSPSKYDIQTDFIFRAD